VFAKQGTFRYFCRVHPGMTGTVKVGASTRPRVTALTARKAGKVLVVRYSVDRSASVRATVRSRGRTVRRFVFRARQGAQVHRLAIPASPRATLRVAVRATTSGQHSATSTVTAAAA
jgi:hypothetical protein